MRNSLKHQLNWQILGFASLFSVLATLISGWLAFEEGRDLQDSLLVHISNIVDAHTVGRPQLGGDIDPDERIIYQRLVSNEPQANTGNSLPIPTALPSGFHVLQFNNITWRVYIFKPQNAEYRYAISQQTEFRDEIARNSAIQTLVPILALTPLLMLLINYLINRNIQPINDLAKSLGSSHQSQIIDISNTVIPTELVPFIESINSLLSRLNRSIYKHRRFVSDAAHAMRTPITGLKLMSENLHQARTPEENLQRAVLLQKGINRTERLVQNLLNLARLQNTTAQKTSTVDLLNITHSVIEQLYPLAEAKQIDLGLLRKESIIVQDQSDSLFILVFNAIDNAIRYTPTGGRVDISIYSNDTHAIFDVSDTGIGMSEDVLTNAFEPFYRQEQNTQGGTGLGLAISAEIATLLNGSIALSNLARGGLQFSYQQPLYTKSSVE